MSRATSFIFADDPRGHVAPAGAKVARIQSVRSKKGLLDALARGLGLPATFGHNWDALEESLREFSWAHGAKSIAIVHEEVPEIGAEDLQTYLDILAEGIAALRAAHDSVPDVQAVFPARAKSRIEQLLRLA